MYLPAHFTETRAAVLHDAIRAHPLATLAMSTPHGLDAEHVPLEIDAEPAPHGTLRGHLARANPAWRECAADGAVLAVFQGPQGYVTPSWYASKREHGKVVPTWNYIVVHAHGALRVVDDAAWLRAFLARLTARHEAGRERPWRIEDAPADFIERQLRAVVGIEIAITRLAGKWKVSQNRGAPDRAGVAAGLRAGGGEQALAMAGWIERAARRGDE
jgi:transcriptional regulator